MIQKITMEGKIMDWASRSISRLAFVIFALYGFAGAMFGGFTFLAFYLLYRGCK